MSLSERLADLNYYKSILVNKYNIQKDDSEITQYYIAEINVNDYDSADVRSIFGSYILTWSDCKIVAAKKNGKIFDVITGFNIEEFKLEKKLMDEYEYGQLTAIAEHSIFVGSIKPITKEEAAMQLYSIKVSKECQKYIVKIHEYQERQKKYIEKCIKESAQEQVKKQYVHNNVDSILKSFNKIL